MYRINALNHISLNDDTLKYVAFINLWCYKIYDVIKFMMLINLWTCYKLYVYKYDVNEFIECISYI